MADDVQRNGDEPLLTEQNADRPTTDRDADEQNDADEEDDDPDPQNDKEYNYNSGENKFKFRKLANVIEKRVNSSAARLETQPPFNDIPTREEHNRRQQEIWIALRTEVAEDDLIPMALFDPPRSFIQVVIAEWPQKKEHFCCPCDLNNDELQKIEIRAGRGSKYGVTKDMIVERLSRELYGNEDGTGWTLGDAESRPVIDHFTWMRTGPGLIGDICAMTRGWVDR